MECGLTDSRARNRHEFPNSARRRSVPSAISASLVATAGLLPSGSHENLLSSCFNSPEERLSSPRTISVLYSELQGACDEGSVEKVEDILSKGVDPNGEILKGKPPLYWAVVRGRLNVVRVLVERYGSSPKYVTHAGTTLFHAACSRGHVDIARYLASTHHLATNAPRKDGSTPMMAACFFGRLDIVKFLAEELRCDTGLPVSRSADGSLLHIACSNDHPEVARYLVTVQKFDPNGNATKSYGETPMHVACMKGCLDILRFLCEERHCSLEVRDASGDTPLHVSAQHDKHQVVKYFIERGCETEVRNDMGNTPLMVACLYGKHNTVKVLLEAGKADPNCQNKNRESPLQCTRDKGIIKELIRYGANTANFVSNVIEYHRKHIPLGALVRMFIIGHPTAGKSTLAKALQEITGGVRIFNKRKVTGVSPLTAGIVPMEFESPDLGRVLLFDFAGQNEYYASHAALLEASKTSAPLFILVVNLLETETEIKSRICFWLSFINSHHVPGASLTHMAVIGSHKDKLKETSLYQKKIATVESLAQSAVQEYQSLHMVGFFAVDCRKPYKQAKLRNKLRESCKELRCDSEVNGCCHVLSAFLCDKFAGKTTCTVEKVISGIEETDLALPCIPERLCELIEALGERQNILFLRNDANLAQSWIVLEVDTLLTKINGSIFAPASFKEHRSHNDSGTGVLAWSHIQRTFLELELDPDLVVAFLRKLEFCEEVFDPYVLNLIQQGTVGKTRERSRSPTYSVSSDIERDGVKNGSPENSRRPSYPTSLSDRDLGSAEQSLSISFERPVFPASPPNNAHHFLPIHQVTPFTISSLLPPPPLSNQHKSHSNPDFESTSNCAPIDVRRSRSCNQLVSKRFFFFPGLLNHERPSEGKIWRADDYFHFHTGWCVQVSHANQFFTARLLQILLLRISFGFAVAKRCECPGEESLSTRQCTVWKNGIRWLDLDGIETVVEMVEQNRAVVVLMRGKVGSELKCVSLRSRLIHLVLNVKRKFCPNLKVTEYLFNPKELENRPYPFARHSLESFTLYEMSAIVRSIVEVKNWVCGTKGTSSSLCSLADLLYFEPYMNLGEALLAQVYLEAVTDDQLYNFLFDYSQAHYTRDSELSEVLDLHKPSFSSSCGTLHMLCSFCSSRTPSLEYSNGYRSHNQLPNIASPPCLSCIGHEGRMDRRDSNPCMAVLDKWWNSSGELSVADFRHKLDKYSLFADRNIPELYCCPDIETSREHSSLWER